jgi:hypothetical protein
MAIKLLENPEIRKMISPVSVKSYRSMCDLGILSNKTELIEGVVIDKMTKSPEHSYYSNQMFDLLKNIKPSSSYLRTEKPLTLKNSEPEPDLMIVQGTLQDYRNENPTSALLVVEIANTSLSADREKIRIYAEALVENYWIVDVQKKQIETYHTPIHEDYSFKKTFNQNEKIFIFEGIIDLSKLFD